MKKIYEADLKKLDIIDCDNDLKAFERARQDTFNKVGAEDLVIVTRLKEFPEDGVIDETWCLNGILPSEEKKIIVMDPLVEHIDTVNHINELETKFDKPITKLSPFSTILMPVSMYKEEYEKYKNIRLYEGDEELAIKMVFADRGDIYLKLGEEGYFFEGNDHIDAVGFADLLKERIDALNECASTVYGMVHQKSAIYMYDHKLPPIIKNPELNEDNHSKKITGLTQNVEGEISLDDTYASTDIGKHRVNQEDGVLLIKNKKHPDIKMMCVADGMGGGSKGELASNIAINTLKAWFENLTDEDRENIRNNISELSGAINKLILKDIQEKIEQGTNEMGGTTLVCALIGPTETLITNIGDSRAYITRDGHLVQVSREDTEVDEKFKEGKLPSKEAERYHQEASIVTQAIGMKRRQLITPNNVVLKNQDYDMVLLFTDGVTDCLSEDDIAAVCRNTDKKELAKKIVESAIRHDSIIPEELEEYRKLDSYINGGKDNATAAVYAPEGKNKEEER